ncbi:hypothetical protein D3C71_1481190 [compost metagenome]
MTGDHHLNSTPSAGKIMKVLNITHRCSRQLLLPARMASRDSLAPCRKNSRAMAAMVSAFSQPTNSPRAGRNEASSTVAINVRVKRSGKNLMAAYSDEKSMRPLSRGGI